MTYYHGSSHKLVLGDVLVARCRPTEFSERRSHDGVHVELFVDDYAPDGFSRLCGLFMVDDVKRLNFVGAPEDYVYEVEPLSDVIKVNFAWFGVVLGMDYLRNNIAAIAAARSYWRGEPIASKYCTDLEGNISWFGVGDDLRDNFEYITNSFRVVRRVPSTSSRRK